MGTVSAVRVALGTVSAVRVAFAAWGGMGRGKSRRGMR